MELNEIYKSVTQKIIDLLVTHQEEWNRPWISFGQDSDYARNAISNRYYRGINQLLLSFGLMEKDFKKNAWLTFIEVKKHGGSIRKGEKSLPIIFYKSAFIDKNKKYHNPESVRKMKIEDWQEKGLRNVPILKLFHVFNIEQTKDLKSSFYEIPDAAPIQDFEKDLRAEELIMSTGAEIEIKESNRAYYDPKNDKIVLPFREQFKGEVEPFYGTALHEISHWSGAKTRLNRKFGKEFGDQEYAMEELVAELSSAFCCAHLGFSKTISGNAAYIKDWLGVLKSNEKAVIKAAYHAQKAADYIIGGEEFVAMGNGNNYS